ncbi:MAG: NAD(P)H-dependent oxidoreductase [Rhodospirillales bacterium]|nr:NAD(P)H-dependent oxidoreductase [Rhodospirillales bacterium]
MSGRVAHDDARPTTARGEERPAGHGAARAARTILCVMASPRGPAAISRQFAGQVLDRLQAGSPEAVVVTRDLAREPPPLVDAAFSAAIIGPPDPDHPALAGSEVLIRELEGADALVIATPMHNYTVPAVLKAWIDQIVRIHRTFTSTPAGKQGRLVDRPVYLVVASGGWFTRPSPVGTPAQPDFLTPYLAAALGTIGLRSLHLLALEGVTRGPEAQAVALAAATARLDALLPPT